MKKYAIFMVLLGATYFIYNFYAYFSGVRSLMTMFLGLLLAISLILSGLNRIFNLEQTHPKLIKYFGITFMIFAFIFFIATIVEVYMSRG
ncbi:MAG: hypothetical protein IKH58_14130 [Bacteroidales bacterium]|nr:hypothetical protein [Bacteroidales bacterium]